MSQIVRDGVPIYVCDGCGSDVGNASVLDAVTIHGMDAAGQPLNLHLGTRCCGPKRLTKAALRWRQTSTESPGAVTFYRPDESRRSSGRGQRADTGSTDPTGTDDRRR